MFGIFGLVGNTFDYEVWNKRHEHPPKLNLIRKETVNTIGNRNSIIIGVSSSQEQALTNILSLLVYAATFVASQILELKNFNLPYKVYLTYTCMSNQ